MNREDLEHIIRAAADVTNEYEFIIVGSQSILGPIPYPPEIFKIRQRRTSTRAMPKKNRC